MNARRIWVVICLLLEIVVAYGAERSRGMSLVQRGSARAVIVTPSDGASSFAAEELQRYVTLLTGVRLPIVTVAQAKRQPAATNWILVGSPRTNALTGQVDDSEHLGFASLKQDGFVIHTAQLAGRHALVVGGNDDAANMYAAYDLIERYGVVFLLTRDIVPSKRSSLELHDFHVRIEPAFSRRGLNVWFGYPNMSVMSTAQLQRYADQIAKLKMNYLQIGWLPYEPWIKYGYRGETKWMGDVTNKESGYLLWTRDYGSYKTSEVSVGQEQFKKAGVYPRLTAPEFQHEENNEQAFVAAQAYMQAFIAAAKRRHIKVWLQIDATSLPPNLARYTTRALDLPFNPLMATFICPNNSVSWELNENRLKSLFATYPDVEGYFLYLSEDYPVCDASPTDRAFYKGLRTLYPTEEKNMEAFTYDIDRKRAVDSNSGSVYLIQKMMAARDQIAPEKKIGIAGIGRLYMLPDLDTLFSKSVPFTDMDSSAAWTPSGVPMELFGGMGDRERTLSNRIDDDSAMLGMQFNVNLYYKDHVLDGAVKYGLAGFASQVSRPWGTETNTKFMAEGEWNPQLTPDEFYRGYSESIFGNKALRTMHQAFDLLEKNEAQLGWTGDRNFECCNAIPPLQIAFDYYKQPNPFDGPAFARWKPYLQGARSKIDRYTQSVQTLQGALVKLREAKGLATPGSLAYLAYLTDRTEAYIQHLQILISWDQAYIDLDEVFHERSAGLEQAAFVRRLDGVLNEFKRTHAQATAMATFWANTTDNPSDLGVLYRIDTFMVTGTEVTLELMQNIDNFHHGRDYVRPVAFNKIFVQWPVLLRDEQRQF